MRSEANVTAVHLEPIGRSGGAILAVELDKRIDVNTKVMGFELDEETVKQLVLQMALWIKKNEIGDGLIVTP